MALASIGETGHSQKERGQREVYNLTRGCGVVSANATLVSSSRVVRVVSDNKVLGE